MLSRPHPQEATAERHQWLGPKFPLGPGIERLSACPPMGQTRSGTDPDPLLRGKRVGVRRPGMGATHPGRANRVADEEHVSAARSQVSHLDAIACHDVDARLVYEFGPTPAAQSGCTAPPARTKAEGAGTERRPPRQPDHFGFCLLRVCPGPPVRPIAARAFGPKPLAQTMARFRWPPR